MVVNALLFTEPLDEVQVAFCVLHAERTRRINHRAKFKHVGIRQDAMLLKDLRNDLRHTALLENPLVMPMCKTGQPGRQGQVITRDAPTWVVPPDSVNLPMQAFVRFTKIQVSGLVEQRLQIKGRVFADHLYMDEKGLIEDFITFECQDLQGSVYLWKNQIET